MRPSFLVLYLSLCVNPNLCKSQSFRGIVLDSISNKPVPFAYVYIEDSETGTITNEDGKFVLKADEAWVDILVTHISYTSRALALSNQIDSATIYLIPATKILPEVMIGNEAASIAKKAFEKITDTRNVNYGKAFYRQVTIDGSTPAEMIETFDDVSFNGAGIQAHKPFEARCARKKNSADSSFFVYSNFSYLTFGFKLFSGKGATIAKPFSSEYFDFYTFQIEKTFEKADHRYAVIKYEPSSEIKTPATNGSFTVDLKTFAVIQYTCAVYHSLGADKLYSGNGKKGAELKAENHQYNWVVSFNQGNENNPRLEYIIVKCRFDLKSVRGQRKVMVDSKLLVYETDLKKKKKLKKPDIKSKDLKVATTLRYNATFWQNNPVIKRTPLEESIAASFENTNAFGTYLSDN